MLHSVAITTLLLTFVLGINGLTWFYQGEKHTCAFMSANNCLQHKYFDNSQCDQNFILCDECVAAKQIKTQCGKEMSLLSFSAAIVKEKYGICKAGEGHGTHLTLDPRKAIKILHDATKGRYEMIPLKVDAVNSAGDVLAKVLKEADVKCLILELYGERMNHAVTITKVGSESVYLDSNRDPIGKLRDGKNERDLGDYKLDDGNYAPSSQKLAGVSGFIKQNLDRGLTEKKSKGKTKQIYVAAAYAIKDTKHGTAHLEYDDEYRSQQVYNGYNGYNEYNGYNIVYVMVVLLSIFILCISCAVISCIGGSIVGYITSKIVINQNYHKKYNAKNDHVIPI